MRNGREKGFYWKGFVFEIGFYKNEFGFLKRWKCKGLK